MPNLTGFVAGSGGTADTLTIDAGILRSAAVVVGVTRGGSTFDPGKEVRSVPFDGKRNRIKGFDRVVAYKPTIKTTLLELKTTDVALIENGATSAVVTGDTVYTPKQAGVTFATGDYTANLNWVGVRGDGAFVEILFPFAVCAKYDLKTKDADEGEISAEFEAVGDSTVAGLSAAPYLIKNPLALITAF